MSQQQMNFGEIPRNEPLSYSAGYEEIPHYQDSSIGSSGQKISTQAGSRAPTAGQRLALALASLVLLLLMFFAAAAVALFAHLSPAIANIFAPVFALMFLGFSVATLVINILFNRKR